MPLYDYKCKACEYEFDDILPIEDRERPEAEPCPGCGESQVVRIFSGGGGGIVSGVELIDKTQVSFRNRIDNIKKLHPAHNIRSR